MGLSQTHQSDSLIDISGGGSIMSSTRRRFISLTLTVIYLNPVDSYSPNPIPFLHPYGIHMIHSLSTAYPLHRRNVELMFRWIGRQMCSHQCRPSSSSFECRYRSRSTSVTPFLLRMYSSSTTKTTNVGLFGVPDLRAPSDFRRLEHECRVKCQALVNEILEVDLSPVSKKKESRIRLSSRMTEVLDHLDDLSNTLCQVLDVAEVCRHVHPDAGFRQAASHCFHSLSTVVTTLNTHKGLYDQVVRVTTSTSSFDSNSQLSSEQKRMAWSVRAEFERDGIHLVQETKDGPDIAVGSTLTEEGRSTVDSWSKRLQVGLGLASPPFSKSLKNRCKREQVRTLQNHITHLSSRFQENLMITDRVPRTKDITYVDIPASSIRHVCHYMNMKYYEYIYIYFDG